MSWGPRRFAVAGVAGRSARRRRGRSLQCRHDDLPWPLPGQGESTSLLMIVIVAFSGPSARLLRQRQPPKRDCDRIPFPDRRADRSRDRQPVLGASPPAFFAALCFLIASSSCPSRPSLLHLKESVLREDGVLSVRSNVDSLTWEGDLPSFAPRSSSAPFAAGTTPPPPPRPRSPRLPSRLMPS